MRVMYLQMSKKRMVLFCCDCLMRLFVMWSLTKHTMQIFSAVFFRFHSSFCWNKVGIFESDWSKTNMCWAHGECHQGRHWNTIPVQLFAEEKKQGSSIFTQVLINKRIVSSSSYSSASRGLRPSLSSSIPSPPITSSVGTGPYTRSRPTF